MATNILPLTRGHPLRTLEPGDLLIEAGHTLLEYLLEAGLGTVPTGGSSASPAAPGAERAR